MAVLCLASSVVSALLLGAAVMLKETRKLYVVRVEDHKPISGECLSETVDADELVYFVERHAERVVVVDVRVGVCPESDQRAENDCDVHGVVTVCHAA